MKSITREIKKYLELNESEKTTNKNLWDAAKEVLKGKVTAINMYIKNCIHCLEKPLI